MCSSGEESAVDTVQRGLWRRHRSGTSARYGGPLGWREQGNFVSTGGNCFESTTESRETHRDACSCMHNAKEECHHRGILFIMFLSNRQVAVSVSSSQYEVQAVEVLDISSTQGKENCWGDKVPTAARAPVMGEMAFSAQGGWTCACIPGWTCCPRLLGHALPLCALQGRHWADLSRKLPWKGLYLTLC